MASLSDLQSLKQRIDNAKQASSKAQGALEQVMLRLKNEHGCSTIKEAKTKLESLERKIQETSLEFDQKFSAFIEKHGKDLE